MSGSGSRTQLLTYALETIAHVQERMSEEAEVALMVLLDEIVRDGQPTPQISVSNEYVTVIWLADERLAGLMLSPDAMWDFWVEDPQQEIEYQFEEQEEMTHPVLAVIHRVLAEMGDGVRYRVAEGRPGLPQPPA